VYRKDRLGIGVEHAEQIYYLALTHYFNGRQGIGDNLDVTFREVRQGVLDACDQLQVDGQHGVDLCDWKTLNTAFYAVGLHPVGVHYGPDPMITPWGVWTGSGPDWQSPDVWCRDAAGAHVNAEKGSVNRLVAQIHNIGDQSANDITVRFHYAPCGFGYQHSDFKLIDQRTIDLVAGETGIVEVDWDLTDLGEDYGGLWPHPVGDFDHFCVRVELVTNDDNDCNSCNNMAQHNFFNVATAPGAFSTMMIVANPFDHFEDWMEMHIHATVPPNWLVLFDSDPQLKSVFLNPREKRAVKVSIEVPDAPLIEWPIDGTLVGKVRGTIGGEIDARLDQAIRTGGDEFEGKLTGRLFEGDFLASFEAQIAGIIMDPTTGQLEGKLWGMAHELKTGEPIEMQCDVLGWLTPERRVSVSGRIRGSEVGGVDLNLVIKR
jgi:hypothetical protein